MANKTTDTQDDTPAEDSGVTLGLSAKEPQRISEVVADDLRARILGNRMAEGARLPSEGELISMLGVSRATVRETLRLLAAEGLITIKRGPQGGVKVRHPDASQVSRSLATLVALNDATLRELFDLRIAIEPPSAAAAARRDLSEADVGRLKAAAAEPHAPVADRVDFHVLVGELSGNSLYYMFLAALHDVLEWHVELEDLSAEDVQQTGVAHERVAKAIIEGNPAAAEKAMGRHLESFRLRMDNAGRLDEAIIPASHWLRGPSRTARRR